MRKILVLHRELHFSKAAMDPKPFVGWHTCEVPLFFTQNSPFISASNLPQMAVILEHPWPKPMRLLWIILIKIWGGRVKISRVLGSPCAH
ncbi:hypothetical protein I7I50_12280 [Histoplasma capsulatum G186AR]|uniref:Uncharacterized protein n=1 Tax=Ajellomyces capsulatus TaxID=5037 RepID=A0A8H7YDD6_AJECA|nr:hypothetical protein I7I52_11408 [Histoplasma capsulatum]QSS70594.1 hypothetical protein I7I50_12280 [Histoplasma capsulatum G186AR]